MFVGSNKWESVPEGVPLKKQRVDSLNLIRLPIDTIRRIFCFAKNPLGLRVTCQEMRSLFDQDRYLKCIVLERNLMRAMWTNCYIPNEIPSRIYLLAASTFSYQEKQTYFFQINDKNEENLPLIEYKIKKEFHIVKNDSPLVEPLIEFEDDLYRNIYLDDTSLERLLSFLEDSYEEGSTQTWEFVIKKDLPLAFKAFTTIPPEAIDSYQLHTVYNVGQLFQVDWEKSLQIVKQAGGKIQGAFLSTVIPYLHEQLLTCKMKKLTFDQICDLIQLNGLPFTMELEKFQQKITSHEGFIEPCDLILGMNGVVLTKFLHLIQLSGIDLPIVTQALLTSITSDVNRKDAQFDVTKFWMLYIFSQDLKDGKKVLEITAKTLETFIKNEGDLELDEDQGDYRMRSVESAEAILEILNQLKASKNPEDVFFSTRFHGPNIFNFLTRFDYYGVNLFLFLLDPSKVLPLVCNEINQKGYGEELFSQLATHPRFSDSMKIVLINSIFEKKLTWAQEQLPGILKALTHLHRQVAFNWVLNQTPHNQPALLVSLLGNVRSQEGYSSVSEKLLPQLPALDASQLAQIFDQLILQGRGDIAYLVLNLLYQKNDDPIDLFEKAKNLRKLEKGLIM